MLLAAMYVAAICAPAIVNAQDPGQGADGPVATTNVPFDGGLTMIVAAGAGYAIKKARDKRKVVSKAD